MPSEKVKNDGGKGKDESLISIFLLKSSCKMIIHQTVKFKAAAKIQQPLVLVDKGCLSVHVLQNPKVWAILSKFCSL